MMGFGISGVPMGIATAGVCVICLWGFCFYVSAKECTNVPPAQSHTIYYQFLTSKNETWKDEMRSFFNSHHHAHVTPTDDSAWASLLPRKMLMEQDEDEFKWNVVYRQMKHPGVFNNSVQGGLLKEVDLHSVRLDPGSMHWTAQQTNLEYLLMLDVDRLVWSFRKTAGLPTPGAPYGGWEAPDIELRGHFVGHYLSATAQMWASTGNEKIKQKMNALLSALKECQDKIGTGYLSAFPSEFFDRFEAIKPVWAPYYTIHKIMAGLLDQYTLDGNPQALEMLTRMVDYFHNRVQNVISKYSLERHWYSLNEEVGGMNDVLYRLYAVTGNQRHLTLAHLFDKPCFLGILAVKADDISGFHANTHIPLVVGAQMRYEMTGDDLYKEIGKYFMDIVNSSHSYATGGTSSGEFWHEPMRLADQLGTETEESCTTYNMLKVSRNMFRWSKQAIYADYYERALTNGVLSIQRGTDPGVMIYMLPLAHGVSKSKSFHGWGNANSSFWCCYGTGIESFSKLGDSIYFEEAGETPGLYLIQYISSSLDWATGKLSLSLKTENVNSSDQRLQVTITVTPKEVSGSSTLNLRVPTWTILGGASASINGDSLSLPAPGNFLAVSRTWKTGDKISLVFPLALRIEPIEDDRPDFGNVNAILYGPYLLAGLSDGDFDIKTGPVKSITDWITPIPPSYNSQLISLTREAADSRVYISKNNGSVTMEASLTDGEDSSIHATFRVISRDSRPINPQEDSAPHGTTIIGHVITLEPFDSPGMVVAHLSEEEELMISKPANVNGLGSFEFRVVKGLDGKKGAISLESQNRNGCFVFGGSKPGQALKLSCNSGVVVKKNSKFAKGASFVWSKGLREYHPISFMAKGTRRSYVLEPLMSLRDEFYNVYFEIDS